MLATLQSFPVMLASAFVIRVMYDPVGPIVNLAMQTRSPEIMRGGVVGIITSAEYAAGPIGYLLVGVATERFGVRTTFLSVAVALIGVAGAGLLVRSLRELDTLPRSVDQPHSAAQVLDVATSGATPLIMPPCDPDHR